MDHNIRNETRSCSVIKLYRIVLSFTLLFYPTQRFHCTAVSISKTNELELCKSKAMNIDNYQKIASLATCLLLFSD